MKKEIKRIDFRVRVPYGGYLQFFENEKGGFAKDFCELPYAKSIEKKSMDLMLQEMEDADIGLAVVPGRGALGVTNDELFEMSHKYPGKFIIFPYINPLEGKKALNDIDKYIVCGEGKGAALEPGFSAGVTYDMDDERIFPVYQKLQELQIPVLLTYSSLGLPYMDMDAPKRLDAVARKFPELVIVVGHAGWPWTREHITIAFMRKNIYLSPDAYGVRVPGSEDYIQAAKTMLQDKMIFGSSYPIIPIKETAEFVDQQWGLTEEIKEKIFYKNAARLLKLED